MDTRRLSSWLPRSVAATLPRTPVATTTIAVRTVAVRTVVIDRRRRR